MHDLRILERRCRLQLMKLLLMTMQICLGMCVMILPWNVCYDIYVCIG